MKPASIFALAFTMALLVYSVIGIFGKDSNPKRNTGFLDPESDPNIQNTKQPLLAITEELPTEEENIEAYFKELQSAMKEESHNKELNFLVFGDFGYLKGKEYNGTLELADFVFNRIKKTFLHYDFIVSVGDSLYEFGVESKNDPNPGILFEEVFKMSQLGLDWYSVLGNHDCMGNLKATYALAKKFPHWKQSESYYHRIFNIGSSHLKAGFVFLNGCELVCLTHDSSECYRGTLKNINFDILQDQVDWLENILAEMADDKNIVWKIVVVHNSIFSAGKSHGDNPELMKAILPLLEKYKVDVVLSGHDHNVQYLRKNLKTDQEDVQTDIKNSKKWGSEVNCPHGIQDECMFGEYFYSQLTECGITKRENQMNQLQALFSQKDKKLIDLEEVRFSRESYSNQNEYLHQFVLGNGCTKVQKYCPFKHRESEGNLRYANTIMGLSDIKIQEDKLEVNLLSTKNEILYSVKILKPISSEKI